MRILSIDGGGVLGCGPVEYLTLLEEELRHQGLPKEDALAGTSVGGLLVACRAMGYTWQEVSDIFDRWVHRIFARPPLWWRMDPTRPKFQDDGIIAATRAVLGNAKCSDARVPFFIPVYDMQNGRPKVFDMTDGDKLADVVMRTCAAPTYFQPRDERWVDGALASNNPSVIGICGAVQKLGARLPELKVLSLNTGGTFWKDPKVGRRMTVLQWASPMINAQLEGNEEQADFQASALLGPNHLRVTPNLPRKFAMDEPEKCAEYRRHWRIHWWRTSEQVTQWYE